MVMPPPHSMPPLRGMQWVFADFLFVDFLTKGVGPMAAAHPEMFYDGIVDADQFYVQMPFVIEEEPW